MSPGDRRPPDDEDDGVSTADRTSSSETDETAANGGDRRSTERLRGDNAAERDIPTRTGSTESDSLWTQFRTANDGPLLLLREVLLSGGIVLLFGLLLFGASGVWPPMVAVESESMEPNINQYDLILVSEPGRFAPEMADRTGVVTANSVAETEHKSFNREGSVVVYQNPESLGPPIIHRTHFYVEDGENWYDRANPEYIAADSCSELDQCPAPTRAISRKATTVRATPSMTRQTGSHRSSNRGGSPGSHTSGFHESATSDSH